MKYKAVLISGIIGLLIGVIFFHIWILILWPIVLAMVLVGMFFGWLIMKKRFMILIIFSILILSFVVFNVTKPLDGVDATNKPIIKFLCPLQNSFARSCQVTGQINDYIIYRRVEDNSCGGGGKNTLIIRSGQGQKDIEKAKQRIIKLYGTDCKYFMERHRVYDQLEYERICRCRISF